MKQSARQLIPGMEHCDWMTGILCWETRPEKIYHSACAAGHKALWHSEWNGLPAASVLEQLDPYLYRFASGMESTAAVYCEGWNSLSGMG